MSDSSKRTNVDKAVKDLITTKSGPFEAIVVSHLDSEYMGSLKVDLLRKKSSGSLPERFGTAITVKYLSPFYGVTNLDHATANDGYASTQKSYGFWAVPPDPGTRVLVIFAENDINRGYWIGCIQDDYMNFMVPDGRASTELTTDATPTNLKGQKLPTGEYNKKVQNGNGKDPTRFQKPYNKDFTQILEIQGLQQDENRGTTSTSARREVPSSVFGWNTPGPVDKREGAPKGKYGEQEYQANVFVNRLGGSSFVMDDGDDKLIRQTHAAEGPPAYSNVEAGNKQGDRTIPHNEMMRFRTRTGHQILLHNSEDLIYIGNARGTSWVEMTSDGKIDIYARDSISVHSDADLNFTADRDVNIEAGRNLNMRASARYNNYSDSSAGNIQMESKYNTSILAENSLSVDVKGSEAHRVGNNRTVYVVGSSSHKTEDSLAVSAGNNISHKAGSAYFSDSGGATSIKSGGAVAIDGSEVYVNSGASASAPGASTAPPINPLITHTVPKVSPGVLTPSDVTSIVKRMPSHEPWPHHENLNPIEYKSSKTDVNILNNLQNSPFSRNFDTFRKSQSSSGTDLPATNNAQPGERLANPQSPPPPRGPVDIPTDLVDYVISKEGFHPTPYWDYAQYTNGYGTRARSSTERINKETARSRLEVDLDTRRQAVVNYASENNYSWNDDQINAMTSFVYNGGLGWLDQVTNNSTRSDTEIASAMRLYNKAGGEVLSGLVTRRNEESAWFAQGIEQG
jgi:GH24 family phage-related lysozyme (muramidase)